MIYFYDKKEIDLIDLEAARYMVAQKINDDHLKLSVESKDILDFLVTNSCTFDPELVEIFMLQVCGKSYYTCSETNITLTTFIILFS